MLQGLDLDCAILAGLGITNLRVRYNEGLASFTYKNRGQQITEEMLHRQSLVNLRVNDLFLEGKESVMACKFQT